MYKLIILIQPEIDQTQFFDGWPEFLAEAEQIPGLVRIVSSPVQAHLTGDYTPLAVHELIFESRPSLEKALASEHGEAAGRALQKITGGGVSLMTAVHMEESGENLRGYRARKESKGG